MRFASSITTCTDAAAAVQELITPVDARVTAGMVDLVILFATAHFDDELEDTRDQLAAKFPHALILGCTAEGTLGCGRELERRPSMALMVASLPDVEIRPFRLDHPQLEAADSAADWERMVGVSPESDPVFIALADPFRFHVHGFLDKINQFYPGAALVGGVASAGSSPGENRLLLGDEIFTEGVVGVCLTGRVKVDTVVSQGCRPIGKPFVITKGERNIVQELGGESTLRRLHDMLVSLPEEDEKLARESLFVGRVIDEHKDQFARGDFLIHNIIGIDRESGAIGIAGHARVGATVQFHVRDPASAHEDITALMKKHANSDVRGVLLFGCNGRGTRMWKDEGHDVGVIREVLGDVPVTGFFCGGEFGPVGGKNFLHGFTACAALFREPGESREPSEAP